MFRNMPPNSGAVQYIRIYEDMNPQGYVLLVQLYCGGAIAEINFSDSRETVAKKLRELADEIGHLPKKKR